MTEPFDPYKVLDVPRDADEKAIKRAARRLYDKVHPDRPGGSTEAFHRVRLAEHLLLDAGRRAKFDADGTADDEDTPERIRSAAIGILIAIIEGVINGYLGQRKMGARDPRQRNVVTDMTDGLKRALTAIDDNLEDHEHALAFTQDFAKRFKAKNATWASAFFEKKIAGIRAGVVNIRRAKAHHEEALRMVADCSFDFDQIQTLIWAHGPVTFTATIDPTTGDIE